MPQLAIGAAIAAGAATFAASAAVAAGGFALFSAAAAVYFAKAFAVSAIAGYLIQKTAPRPSQPGVGGGSVRGSSRIVQDSVIPKRWILGRARTPGALVWFRHLDDRLAMVLALGEGAMDSIEGLWVDGEKVEITRDAATRVITPAQGSRFLRTRNESYTVTYYEVVYDRDDGGGNGDGPDRDRADPDSGRGGSRPGGGGGWDDADTVGPIIHDGRGIASVYRGAVQWVGRRFDVFAQGEGGGNINSRRNYRRVKRTRRRTRTVSFPTIKVTEYFKADGTEGARIREIAAESLPGDSATQTTASNDLDWTAAHRLNNVSYVLVELVQPAHENTTEGVQGRFWNRLPNIEFLVKGLKVPQPVVQVSSTAPPTLIERPAVWTDNAATLRYWFLTRRRLIDRSRIDPARFVAAVAKCGELVDVSELPGYSEDYPARIRRYTINGVVNADDSAQALERQFDICWNGEAVQWNGGFYFRPGADETLRLTVPERDIIAEPIVRPSLPRENRANEVRINLEQSSVSDYRSMEFVVEDSEKQSSDGERLPTSVGTQSFLNQPAQAINIMHQQLRAQRYSMQVDVKVMPREDYRYIELVPGDRVELQIEQFGIGQGERPVDPVAARAEVRDFRVLSSSVNADLSVDLRLAQWPYGWHTDEAYEFPAVAPRAISIPAPVNPPVGDPVVITHNADQNGIVTWEATLSFAPSPHRVVAFVESPLTNRQVKRSDNNEMHFTFNDPGTYTFYAYNETADGRTSSVVSSTAEANYLGIPLPTPVPLSPVQVGNILHIPIRNIPNRIIAGAEVKYTRGALTVNTNTLGALTEADWDNALEMNVTTTLPRGEDQPLLIQAPFPSSGTFRVFMRLVSRVDTLSPIVEVGVFRFEYQASTTGGIAAHPLWAGTAENMLLWPHDDNSRLIPDRHDRNAVTFEEWDGQKRLPTGLVSAWPFGDNSGFGKAYNAEGELTYYDTLVIDLLETISREFTVSVETDSPAGATPAGGYDIVFRHSVNQNLASADELFVVDGRPFLLAARSIQVRVHFRDIRSRALIALTIGWRDLA